MKPGTVCTANSIGDEGEIDEPCDFAQLNTASSIDELSMSEIANAERLMIEQKGIWRVIFLRGG